MTTIFVNLKQATRAKEVPDIWYHVRKSIGDIRHTLPAGVAGPFFDDEFGDTYGIIYGFTADGFTHRELRDYVEDIRSRLLQVPDVLKIEVLGAQDERIFVEFSTKQLAGLGVDRAALVSALQAQNMVIPSGTIQTGNEKLFLRVSGAFDSEASILAVNFVANGRLIRLRDIAQVHRTYADPPQPMFRVNGEPAIGLAIAMREGGDILTLGKNIRQAMQEVTANPPIGIEPTLVADQPHVVDHAIGEFTTSLWQAIVIIMAVSFISLGIRAGTVVALSIPLTLALEFPIMQIAGIDLQRISLGALIIALSLLVDDAMTTIDVMTTRLAEGDSKVRSATFAYETLAFPMLTGSFVTAAAFVPIGFARSSAGEYTFSIFAVVSIALIASWFIAVIFGPLLGVALLTKPKETRSGKPNVIMRVFRGLLIGAMRARWLTIAATIGCLVLAFLALPHVPRQFFPSSDRPELLVDLRLPQNASIYASDELAGRLDGLLKGDPDVERWSTSVGRGAIRFYLPLAVELQNDFFSQAVVIAKNLPAAIRKVNFDWMEPARMVRVRVDQDQARLLGLSSQAVASVLNSVVSGTPVTQVRDGIYLVDVIARATDEQRVSLSTLRSLQVPLPNGRTVPLSQLATFDFQQEYPLIWRRDRVPTSTVQAEVAPGGLPEAAVASLAPAIEKLNSTLPPSYHIAVGGVVEESARSQASVFAVVPVTLLIMVTLLMIQLQSFSRVFLVLAVVPMGLIGVVGALLLFNRALGFVAILGVLSLTGMIARNVVILIEQIEAERKEGTDAWNAVIKGALSRFRPIMLTAISTVLGMIPIASTIFWGPMAFAIMGGLLVATVLTLIFLPALYVACFRVKEPRTQEGVLAPARGD